MTDFTADALARFYERAGKYQFDAGMAEEDADKRAYMQEVRG